jgi:hypothetical protein
VCWLAAFVAGREKRQQLPHYKEGGGADGRFCVGVDSGGVGDAGLVGVYAENHFFENVDIPGAFDADTEGIAGFADQLATKQDARGPRCDLQGDLTAHPMRIGVTGVEKSGRSAIGQAVDAVHQLIYAIGLGDEQISAGGGRQRLGHAVAMEGKQEDGRERHETF